MCSLEHHEWIYDCRAREWSLNTAGCAQTVASHVLPETLPGVDFLVQSQGWPLSIAGCAQIMAFHVLPGASLGVDFWLQRQGWPLSTAGCPQTAAYSRKDDPAWTWLQRQAETLMHRGDWGLQEVRLSLPVLQDFLKHSPDVLQLAQRLLQSPWAKHTWTASAMILRPPWLVPILERLESWRPVWFPRPWLLTLHFL